MTSNASSKEEVKRRRKSGKSRKVGEAITKALLGGGVARSRLLWLDIQSISGSGSSNSGGTLGRV